LQTPTSRDVIDVLPTAVWGRPYDWPVCRRVDSAGGGRAAIKRRLASLLMDIDSHDRSGSLPRQSCRSWFAGM